MAHTGYTIQMTIKNITIHLKDGSVLSGQIFVSEYSRLHAGQEKISEFFENEQLFFPFKTGNDFIIFSKNFVSHLEFEPEDDFSLYRKIEATITLMENKTINVKVPLLVPSPVSRLSDQINSTEKFLLCEIPGKKNHILINKSHIISAKEIN